MRYNYYDILSIDEIIDRKVDDYDMKENYKEEMKRIFIELNDLLNYYFPYNGKLPPYQEDNSSNIITCWHNSNYLLKIDFKNGFGPKGFQVYSYIFENNNLHKDTYSIFSEKQTKKRGEVEIKTKNVFLERCVYKEVPKEYKIATEAVNFVENEKYLIPDDYKKIELDGYHEECTDFLYYNDYDHKLFTKNYGYKASFNRLFDLCDYHKEEIDKDSYKVYKKILKELKSKD